MDVMNKYEEHKQKIKPSIKYNFNKVNLSDFSKKKLISIIYELNAELDYYKGLVSDE